MGLKSKRFNTGRWMNAFSVEVTTLSLHCGVINAHMTIVHRHLLFKGDVIRARLLPPLMKSNKTVIIRARTGAIQDEVTLFYLELGGTIYHLKTPQHVVYQNQASRLLHY